MVARENATGRYTGHRCERRTLRRAGKQSTAKTPREKLPTKGHEGAPRGRRRGWKDRFVAILHPPSSIFHPFLSSALVFLRVPSWVVFLLAIWRLGGKSFSMAFVPIRG
jgi:hypothetical protein